MRTLIISDIHGCYIEFCELLDYVNYQPNIDRLILLGDYVDKGPNSKEVVEKVKQLSNNDNVILIRGNHDGRFADFITGQTELYDDFMEYGGIETLESYFGKPIQDVWEAVNYIYKNYKPHLEFLKQTKLYFEDDSYIYVHAGIDPEIRDWRKQPEDTFYSIREKFYQVKTNLDKVVVFGHTPTFKITNCSDIWFSEDKICVDGGCFAGYKLNCLEISEQNELAEYSIKSKKVVN